MSTAFFEHRRRCLLSQSRCESLFRDKDPRNEDEAMALRLLEAAAIDPAKTSVHAIAVGSQNDFTKIKFEWNKTQQLPKLDDDPVMTQVWARCRSCGAVSIYSSVRKSYIKMANCRICFKPLGDAPCEGFR